ncbi:hypothetical protein CAOG_004616, partial [Capsaspora owczarzaki ATCC 30864]
MLRVLAGSQSTARKKAGWLTKQGGSNKGWKRRWCVFENNCLAYFKSEQDREYAGIVYVEDMRSITIDQEESRKDNRYPYCFRVDTPDRAYMFCAESAADMDDWISMFKSVWQEEPRYLTGTLQFATAECFVDSGLRINGAVEASVLSVFSEGITPKQKRKDERGWFIDKQVSV